MAAVARSALRAVVVVEAGAPAAVVRSRPTSPLFWQYLLAAELSAEKSREVVEALGTSSSDPVSFLLSCKLLTDAERRRFEYVDTSRLERALANGACVVEPEGFGQDLLQSPSPPAALFAWGETSCLTRPMVAIVGTRGASAYGKAVAQKFAEAFVRAGLVVASGGAMGIDENAHAGALDAGGQTVVVLANGVDIVQPPKNGPLFERVRASGCLVSPYAIGTPAMDYRFRPRNELLAAMSRAVLVVEAPEVSGSLVTSSAAGDLGREVFVVPGTIDRPGFRGSHRLIRDGATLVDDPGQVLESLGIEAATPAQRAESLSEPQRSILQALSVDPQAPEKLVHALGIPVPVLMAELTEMEMEGLVVRSGGGYAIKP